MSLAVKYSRAWANMINREQRLGGLGEGGWCGFCSFNPHWERSMRGINIFRDVGEGWVWRKGKYFLPSTLTGRQEEKEREEVEEDAVAGLTSHGGLSLLKIRKWYFPLFQMSSSGFLFIELF